MFFVFFFLQFIFVFKEETVSLSFSLSPYPHPKSVARRHTETVCWINVSKKQSRTEKN